MKTSGPATMPKNNQGRAKTFKDVILENQDAIKKVLPQHITVERFTRAVIFTAGSNPKLANADKVSLFSAILQSAQLGLEPGILGQAYLIPYRNNKKGITEVQFQIGYKGYIQLARRSGEIQTIKAEAVHENDFFEYEFGFEETLRHKPALNNRGKIVQYYAYAILKDGGRSAVVISKQDAEAHRDKYSKVYSAYKTGPWKDEFDEMAKKTAIIKLLKYLPVSIEALKDLHADSEERNVTPPEMMQFDAIPEMQQTEALEQPEPEPKTTQKQPAANKQAKQPKPEQKKPTIKKQPETDLPPINEEEEGQGPPQVDIGRVSRGRKLGRNHSPESSAENNEEIGLF